MSFLNKLLKLLDESSDGVRTGALLQCRKCGGVKVPLVSLYLVDEDHVKLVGTCPYCRGTVVSEEIELGLP